MATYYIIKDLGIVGRAPTPREARETAIRFCDNTQDVVRIENEYHKDIGFIVMSMTPAEGGILKITHKYRSIAKKQWYEIATDGRLKTEKKEKKKLKLPFGL